LIANKSGYVENAFYCAKLGKEIALCWGFYNAKEGKGCGLAKIISKHIEKYKDFESVEKAMNVIDGILRNPKLKLERNMKTGNYNISDGKYLIAFNENEGIGTFLISAYKKSIKMNEKKK